MLHPFAKFQIPMCRNKVIEVIVPIPRTQWPFITKSEFLKFDLQNDQSGDRNASHCILQIIRNVPKDTAMHNMGMYEGTRDAKVRQT